MWRTVRNRLRGVECPLVAGRGAVARLILDVRTSGWRPPSDGDLAADRHWRAGRWAEGPARGQGRLTARAPEVWVRCSTIHRTRLAPSRFPHRQWRAGAGERARCCVGRRASAALHSAQAAQPVGACAGAAARVMPFVVGRNPRARDRAAGRHRPAPRRAEGRARGQGDGRREHPRRGVRARRSSSDRSRRRPYHLSADTAAMLFCASLAFGQINRRKVDGWQTLATRPIDQPLTTFSGGTAVVAARSPAACGYLIRRRVPPPLDCGRKCCSSASASRNELTPRYQESDLGLRWAVRPVPWHSVMQLSRRT